MWQLIIYDVMWNYATFYKKLISSKWDSQLKWRVTSSRKWLLFATVADEGDPLKWSWKSGRNIIVRRNSHRSLIICFCVSAISSASTGRTTQFGHVCYITVDLRYFLEGLCGESKLSEPCVFPYVVRTFISLDFDLF
jgi:hypothetical protein